MQTLKNTPLLSRDDIQDRLDSDSEQPDSETKREVADLDKAEKQAHIDGLRQDTAERKLYANRIYWLVALWLVGIFVLMMCQGFLSPHGWFQLENSVLLAAIGGTTVNVIGIFVVVTRYLFPGSRR